MFHYIERAPDGVTVKDIQSHSIQVSWKAVEDANNYNVTLTQKMGDSQLGICSESYTLSVDTSSLSVNVGQTSNEMLKAYTTYSITVIAMSDVWGDSEDSEPIIITTNQTNEDYYSAFSV